jgi:hypothetical protein
MIIPAPEVLVAAQDNLLAYMPSRLHHLGFSLTLNNLKHYKRKIKPAFKRGRQCTGGAVFAGNGGWGWSSSC